MRRARRVLRLALAAGALAVVFLAGDAKPAAADNCSGLNDCYFVSKSAVTVTVGIGTVAVVLLLTPPIGGSPDVKPLDPSNVPTKTKSPSAGSPPDHDPSNAPKGPHDAQVELGPQPEKVKVAHPDGSVVDRPVKPSRPLEDEALVRTKVRDAEKAVTRLPRPRQKSIFEQEAFAAGHQEKFKGLAEAIRRGAPPEEWVRTLNPTGDRANAAATVNAIDAALDKVPRIAKSGGAVTADALASMHDSVVTQVADLGEVHQFLVKAGPGARGVITVHFDVPASWANAVPVKIGHAFNVGNVDGRIVFLDGQTGAVSVNPNDLLAATGHDPATLTSVRFVPTHPHLA
jgi:hypothetical protein